MHLKNTCVLIFILFFFLLSQAGGGPSLAQASQKTSDRGEQIEEQKGEYDAHRLYVKLHFDDVEMDFVLQWVLGSTIFGGCEIGEAFYTVGNIKNGDPKSWQEGWAKLARQVEQRGQWALSAGHRVSARESFLKASNYYRTAVVSVMPDDPNMKLWGDKCRQTFRQACKLFDPPIEVFEVPFEGTTLPGYFQKVDSSGKKRKTLVMIGGAETFVEELYFYIAPAAIKRGYNFLSADIPGQGMLPMEGQFYRADSDVPIKALLDYALARYEIDPERLAMYGISGGGLFCAQNRYSGQPHKGLRCEQRGKRYGGPIRQYAQCQGHTRRTEKVGKIQRMHRGGGFLAVRPGAHGYQRPAQGGQGLYL
ncbi:alpha/beta hydrolase family protein [Dethiosulfatarculus sandiegensis]|uniref:alpha/beta hydrolase family protein n=1 Tax=Dethiosulfatarculus sandiegensis TaxID=1429043 RepID=UPI000698F71A|nr:hypothetical protein [Dethiosulfatarculus sandiegensis]